MTGSQGDRHITPEGRVKVLFLMIQMAMGGTERLILNLVKRLDRNVFAPSVGWFVEEQPLKEFEELQIPLHYIPKRARFDWSAVQSVNRIIRQHRIDIVNAHHFMPFFYAYYGSKIAHGARLVYTEHSEADVLAAAGRWRTVGTCLVPSCEAVIGVSDRVSRTLVSHFRLNPQRVHTIENGVDVGGVVNSGEDRARLRAAAGFAPQDVLIGHVANFRRNKNHLFLLKAFREVAATRRDVRLVFVGQGFPGDPENSEPEVRTYIQEHGLEDRVRLMGYRPDVQALLGMTDVFCLVSYKEGLPLSLLEAMASGLPVVGTDIEGIRGLIEPETNGLVVTPDDVQGLQAVLTRMVDDAQARQRMGAASRRAVTEKYSVKRCLDETERLFLSILPPQSLEPTAA